LRLFFDAVNRVTAFLVFAKHILLVVRHAGPVCKLSESVKHQSGVCVSHSSTTSSSISAVEWSKVLRPTRHKIGHFGDVLPSQALGSVLKKNKTQQN